MIIMNKLVKEYNKDSSNTDSNKKIKVLILIKLQ